MPEDRLTQSVVRKRTIKAMRSLGTYRKEFDLVIGIFAALVEQYDSLLKEFEAGGSQYEVATGAEGVKKSPVVASLETLRKDILQYSDRLCLNPKAFRDDAPKPGKKSILAQVLAGQQ